VAAVLAGTCWAASTYPNPYQLTGYENCLDNPLIAHFLQQQPFVRVRVIEFFEKLPKIDSNGCSGMHHPLDKWMEANTQQPRMAQRALAP
jgi:hypothetical protein